MKTVIKWLYNRLPLKHQLFKILKNFWQPPESILKHLHFKGVLSLKIRDKSFKMQHYGYMIENEAFWLGLDNGWEKMSMGLWSKLSKECQVIFDIGANTGIYSLVAQTISPNAQVFAFEPVKRVWEKLQYNIHINGFQSIAVEKATSNYDGVATIYEKKDSEHILSVTVNKNLLSDETETILTEIETVRLDTFIENNDLERIDLMKIDVETHEPEVLEGMGRYLDDFRPTMLIEILSDEVGHKVEKHLKGLGYLFFNVDEEAFSIRKVDVITKSDCFNYLICQPKIAGELGLL